MTLLTAGCASNPIAIAETPAQKGYAIERSYNILLEQGVSLARTSDQVRAALQSAELRATPVVDSLSDALAAYEVARAEYELAVAARAEDVPRLTAQLTVVAQNLERWVAEARAALVELANALP